MLDILLAPHGAPPTPTVALNGWSIAAIFMGPAVVAAVISGAVTFLTLYPASKLRRAEAAEVANRNVNERALNEFYSPLRELLNEVKVLRAEITRRVNTNNESGWHTLDHVAEIKADDDSWELFDTMVRTNDRIKQILDEKSGLARGAVTASALWRVHQSLLSRALANPDKVPTTELSYFPKEFETQINAKFEELSAELDANTATDKRSKKAK